MDGLGYVVALAGKRIASGVSLNLVLSRTLGANIFNIILFQEANKELQVCPNVMYSQTPYVELIYHFRHLGEHNSLYHVYMLLNRNCRASLGYAMVWIMSQRILIKIQSA